MNMLYENEMREYILARVGPVMPYTSQRDLADSIGIDATLLSRMLRGERPVNDKVAEFFGFKRVVLFVIPEPERNVDDEK